VYSRPDEGYNPITTDKFCCPFCGTWQSRVVDSRPDPASAERYLRWRHCSSCHQLYETEERVTGKKLALHTDPPQPTTGA